ALERFASAQVASPDQARGPAPSGPTCILDRSEPPAFTRLPSPSTLRRAASRSRGGRASPCREGGCSGRPRGYCVFLAADRGACPLPPVGARPLSACLPQT